MTASMSTPHIQLAAWSSDAGMTGNKGRLNGRADPAAGKKKRCSSARCHKASPQHPDGTDHKRVD